jgi:hypothetical protein
MHMHAQEKPLAWYEANFPKEHAIRLLDETNIVIQVDAEKGVQVSTTYVDEKMLVSGQAAAFSERQIVFSSFFNVRDVEASSYDLKNSGKYSKNKIEEFRTEKIMNDRVFHDDLQAVKFKYPDLKKGSKIALKYTEDALNPFFVAPVYFQDAFFAEKIRVTLQAPENVKIKINKFNLENTKVAYTTSVGKGIITHVWEVDSVPKFESESGAPDFLYYVPHISFIIESYQENNVEVPVLRGVPDLYRWYRGLLDSVDHTLTPALKQTVDSIVQENPLEIMQAKALYNWVRNSIKYIAVEDGLGGFIPDNPSAVARKRFGDCKGMSCLLATMMRHAGLDAHECWIGTRDIPYTYTENYTPFVDNHMITAYKHNNTWYFLDATDEFIPFGYPSAFIQGKEALIGIDKENYVLETVPVMSPPASKTTIIDTLTLEGEHLKGKALWKLSGYEATDFRRKSIRQKDERQFYKYFLELGNNKFELTNLPKKTETDSVVALDFSFKIPDYARNFDGKYLVNLNMDEVYSGNSLEDRKLPMELDYGYSASFDHYLKIPEGYEVRALPDNVILKEAFAEVQISYAQSGGFVHYRYSYSSSSLLLAPSEVAALDEMGKQLRKAYRFSVELSKKQ